jgi:hypothetical protein
VFVLYFTDSTLLCTTIYTKSTSHLFQILFLLLTQTHNTAKMDPFSVLNLSTLNAAALDWFVQQRISREMISYLAEAAFSVIQCDPNMMPPPAPEPRTGFYLPPTLPRLPPLEPFLGPIRCGFVDCAYTRGCLEPRPRLPGSSPCDIALDVAPVAQSPRRLRLRPTWPRTILTCVNCFAVIRGGGDSEVVA